MGVIYQAWIVLVLVASGIVLQYVQVKMSRKSNPVEIVKLSKLVSGVSGALIGTGIATFIQMILSEII